MKKLYIFLSAAAFFALQSCSYTKHVPAGHMLLMDNDIYVNGEQGAPEEAENILKQQPNSGFWLGNMFVSIPLGFYSWGSGGEDNFFSKLGTPPVILDTTLSKRGANQLENWYFRHGYFNATTSYSVDTIKRNPQKAEVKYRVKTGDRYYIDEIAYEVENKQLMSYINYFGNDSYVDPGDPYNEDEMDRERSRLAQIFQNHGYYNFNRNFITFQADTFQTGDSVDLKMIISKRPIEQGDTVIYRDHEVHHIKDIFIRPDLSYLNLGAPSDTLLYRGYYLAYDTLRYEPRYLTDAIHFNPGDRYEQRDVRDTYAHLVGYRAFQLTEVSFEPGPRDSLGPTLIGLVRLNPLPKRTFSIEPEFTNTSGYIGMRGSIGWTNRNIFGAGETLEVRFNLGLEYQPTPGTDQFSETFEIGGEANLAFPRFLLPFNTVGLLPKRMRPHSTISLAVNQLDRVEFERETFRTRLSYIWKESLLKTHQVDLVDISYSWLYIKQQSFINNLSTIQQRAFQSEFIGGSRYTFTYNEQIDPDRDNFRFFKGTFELAGNTLSLLDGATPVGEVKGDGVRQIMNVQYFQYGRVDVDGRYYWNLSNNRVWVNRVLTGYILPYGNSVLSTDSGAIRIPPFSKYFYMGGSNDLRAWPAYRLGAGRMGNTHYEQGLDTSFSTGTFKFLFNSEYRFPMFSSLKGAVFMDMGNIWYTGGLQNEKTDLNFGSFFNEMAIGTGLGLRLDLDFFVIRLDVGAKVRDPGLLDEDREWVIVSEADDIFKNLTYHIALGYPF